jgi:hypothetical protein
VSHVFSNGSWRSISIFFTASELTGDGDSQLRLIIDKADTFTLSVFHYGMAELSSLALFLDGGAQRRRAKSGASIARISTFD